MFNILSLKIYNDLDLMSLTGPNISSYAMNVVKAIFKPEEYQNGIILIGNKPTRSKTKVAMDKKRIDVLKGKFFLIYSIFHVIPRKIKRKKNEFLKDAICRKFNITEERLEQMWANIRTVLHSRFTYFSKNLKAK